MTGAVDMNPSVWRGSQGSSSLENQYNLVMHGKIPCRVVPVSLNLRSCQSGEPGHLTRMRCQHNLSTSQTTQQVDVPAKSRQAIGIDHNGKIRILEESTDQHAHFFTKSQTGPDGQCLLAMCQG